MSFTFFYSSACAPLEPSSSSWSCTSRCGILPLGPGLKRRPLLVLDGLASTAALDDGDSFFLTPAAMLAALSLQLLLSATGVLAPPVAPWVLCRPAATLRKGSSPGWGVAFGMIASRPSLGPKRGSSQECLSTSDYALLRSPMAAARYLSRRSRVFKPAAAACGRWGRCTPRSRS